MICTEKYIELQYRLSGRARNSLIISLMGGGNLLALISGSFSSADYCPRRGGRRLLFSLALCAVVLLCSACRHQSPQTICGVPVQGTPWQLAAAIHDSGDGTFIVESVDLITETKAYISGWLPPDELPAQIICDLSSKGEVTAAVLHCETLDKE